MSSCAGTVVVIDEGWVCLEQIAVALHARGVRVVWISLGMSREAALRRQLTLPGARVVGSIEEVRPALERLRGQRVLDILCPEHYLPDLAGMAASCGLDPTLVAELDRRVGWLDKWESAARLHEGGVPTPRKVELDGGSVDRAVDLLGLPLVVKGRVGAGGDAVAVARTREQAQHAMEDIAGRGFSVFAEQFVEGHGGQYVAAYLPGGRIVQECTYVSRRLDEVGPPVGAVATHDPALCEVGRRTLATTGGYGLANVETVMTKDGQHLVIDLNLRPWGTFLAWREAGLDFVDGYLRAIGAETGEVTWVDVPSGRQVDVYPSASKAMVSQGLGGSLRHFVRESAKYVRWVSARYVLMTAVAYAKFLLVGEPATGRRPGRVGGVFRRS